MKPDTRTPGPAAGTESSADSGISATAMFVANPDVSCRIEGDAGAVLFNPDTDTTRLINPTGILIWNYLSEPHTVGEIVAFVAGSYSNLPDTASVQKDAEAFVKDLAPGFVSEC
ncbi:MAG: PqqD family peptide modification chaperone [Methanoregula sp.]|nr:PqqD family peptide modification chaperone [Methanoregula sp.]